MPKDKRAARRLAKRYVATLAESTMTTGWPFDISDPQDDYDGLIDWSMPDCQKGQYALSPFGEKVLRAVREVCDGLIAGKTVR